MHETKPNTRPGTPRRHPTPASKVRAALRALEREVLPFLENDWHGQDVLGALRRTRKELVLQLIGARWRAGRKRGGGKELVP